MLNFTKSLALELLTVLSTYVKKNEKRKLNTLIKLVKLLALKQRRILMKTFFIYQFACCPLVSNFSSRRSNHKVSHNSDLRKILETMIMMI